MSKPAVVYIGHLPHGFYEHELFNYFIQFGPILDYKVARCKKTGQPKGYAFIKFKHSVTAQSVVEAMNGYLFFERQLKCELVPREKWRKNMFKGWKTMHQPHKILIRNKINKPRSVKQIEKSNQIRVTRLQESLQKLKDMGINYVPKVDIPKKAKKKLAVVELDTSEIEITLKTPPKAVKVKKARKSKA